ncbi:hypothetical protein DFH07DRAFT_796361 [Mycena maculata]|uniref:DUF6534 domain-containing protein n=1 Tax=Mycena maculata TaxID=230809 RepID=A0AAD7NW96_9AGAR|nr:hypothetical protein DFH07DRAFT_796361 [Mycena maculata]
MDPQQRHEAIFLLGPWLVGGCVDLFLQGILCCQIFNYFSWYNEDNMTLRLFVGGLLVLSLLKSIQAFAIIWIQSILFINNLDGAILLNYTAWWQAGNPMIVAAFDLYVQSYFMYRLFVISKKWFVVAPLLLIFLFAFFSMIVATYYITVGASVSSKISEWFAAHLSSVFAADALMTCTTAYFLLRTKKNVLPQTVGLISALVRLTFQTAAPAAICAMFNLIFSQIYVGTDKLISTAFNMALPKLYAVSMMWTLNARRTIRASHSNRGGLSSSNEISGGRTRRTRANNDVELGAFNGHIQVHTAQETIQHIDVRDMFSHPEDETKTAHDTAPSLESEYKRPD